MRRAGEVAAGERGDGRVGPDGAADRALKTGRNRLVLASALFALAYRIGYYLGLG